MSIMSTEFKIEHIFLDHETNKTVIFEKDTLENELDRIVKSLEIHFEKLEKIGNYELSNVQVNIGVNGNILVIGLNGGITLTYTQNSKQEKTV